MTDRSLRVLGIHGLGDHRSGEWKANWSNALDQAFPKIEGVSLDPHYMTYDDIFEDTEISAFEAARAFWKLSVSGLAAPFRRRRGILSDASDKIKWTAGYVVAWLEDEEFKRRSREKVLATVVEQEPDIILAHSLGSLVSYNAFTHPDAKAGSVRNILRKARYVTLGSQIGNPFVIRNLTNGRIQPLDVAFWHHLYNRHDSVFTAEIRIWDADNFRQTETPFDIDGIADHGAVHYFKHESTVDEVWRPIAQSGLNARSLVPVQRAVSSKKKTKAQVRQPCRKALLVGINNYPDVSMQLEGCVNDVFTMSAVLQQCGFQPDTIRTCLDGRATASGILERLAWLLDEPGPGDELIFYYSGHGAQIPEYGENFEPDRHLESLVPWDFDWSRERSISDDQIYALYSQLPYETRLVMIFDCCHSGGIHRDGGMRPKGLTPPDDIRHRELKWDTKTEMWVSRDFTRINRKFTRKKAVAEGFFGKDGATARLGRGSMLRGLSDANYKKLKKTDERMAKGAYLPLILEACSESQYAYEYRHGATSHGAFTYSLANILRRRKKITFDALAEETRKQLADLQYDQTPAILGPGFIRKANVPWISS